MDGRKTIFNQIASISTDTPSEQKQISFLIEGFSAANHPSEFPEAIATVNLAKANKCEYFDPISSYDTEQIGYLLKDKPENEQKAILLGIYLDWVSEGSRAAIIETFLKKPYQEFFGEMPTWLSNLSSFNMETFATKLLQDMFDGKIENFKAFDQLRKKDAIRLSDEISARRLMAYIKERPELNVIYGLIGSLHLNMLNHCGKVIEQADGYRFVRITISGKSLDVHLYGGKHGETTDYEILAKRAKKDGLIIPKSSLVEDKSMESLIKLLLTSGSFSLQVSSSPHLTNIDKKDTDQERLKHKEKETFSNEKLAEKFDYWMKSYNHPSRPDDQLLIAWLYQDEGGHHIKNYKQFCALSSLVHQKGYATDPPPSESAFNRGMEKYYERYPRKMDQDRMFKKKESKGSSEISTDVLADHFDYWMRNYNHPTQSDVQHLIDWLVDERGGQHIKNYKHFCELATLLHQKGYLTDPPPIESEFRKGMEVYSKRPSQNLR